MRKLFVSLLVFLTGWACLPTREMSEGELLYRSKCSVCHIPLKPESRPCGVWEKYVERYAPTLSPEEREKMLRYLTDESLKALRRGDTQASEPMRGM